MSLIGMASIYVFFMIYSAYKSKRAQLESTISSDYDYEYQYQTESYDFGPYQSYNSEGDRSLKRGFCYNKSIASSKCDFNDNDDNFSEISNQF